MDFIRALVSGSRNRLATDDGFNLDLSYITKRLIAMSYPAEDTLEGLYRNRIEDVAAFLNSRHRAAFLVLNLSERPYSSLKLPAIELGFPDHFAPPLELAWTLCLTIDGWLSASEEHVGVVHCLAGKGRTGVILCCYLLFSGHFFADGADGAPLFSLPSPRALSTAALAFFKEKRGEGVTYASQERTVYYLARVIHAAIVAEDARLSRAEPGAVDDPSAPLPPVDLSVNARGTHGANGTTLVRRDALRRVRRVRTLPLPAPVSVRLARVIISGLPDAALRPPAGAEATAEATPPRLRITSMPFQGAPTLLFYDSALQDLPGTPSRKTSSPAGSVLVPHGVTAAVLFHPMAMLRGDLLLTLRLPDVKGKRGEVLRAAMHSSFFVTDGPAGCVRLTRRDVDQGSSTRAMYRLGDDFSFDLFFERGDGGGEGEGEGEGGGDAAAEGGAATGAGDDGAVESLLQPRPVFEGDEEAPGTALKPLAFKKTFAAGGERAPPSVVDSVDEDAGEAATREDMRESLEDD